MKRLNRTMVIVALVLFILAILSVIFSIGFPDNKDEQKEITSFLDCVKAGYSILESMPRQCIDDKGKRFVEDVQI